jgi:hypothetical protein
MCVHKIADESDLIRLSLSDLLHNLRTARGDADGC